MLTRKNKTGLCRIRAVARVAGFLLLVQTVLLLLMARSGHARVNELMLAFGTHMMRYADARRQDRPRALFVNGLALRFASGSTDREVDDVLDHFHAKCRNRNGRFCDQLHDVQERLPRGGKAKAGRAKGLAQTPAHNAVAGANPLDGVLRYGGGELGFVGCLDTGGRRVRPEQMLKKAWLFLQTGALSSVGELRYVMAERANKGTHFVAFWTRGDANLYEAFPPQGDAPGRDPKGIPRPPGSRRLLSAWEQNEAPSMTVYATPGLKAPHLGKFYRTRLREMGWRVADAPTASAGTETEIRALWAERGPRTVSVTFLTDSRGQGLAALAEML